MRSAQISVMRYWYAFSCGSGDTKANNSAAAAGDGDGLKADVEVFKLEAEAFEAEVAAVEAEAAADVGVEGAWLESDNGEVSTR